MSSRRNGSVSRAAETASKNRLHMDRNPQHSRITDPSNPAGRRKEIDNVMKRARQASPGSWDRKLLEVEEKDPNRWRHTGYKQLYLEGSGSASPKRSRSPITGRRSRTRSPPPLRRSRSPIGRRSPRKSRTPRRSPRRSPVSRRRSRSAARRARAEPRRPRPPSPPPRQSSGSGSSVSSCSDESCSVCSAKNKKGPPAPPKGAKPPPPRPKSNSPSRKRPAPAAASRAVQPTRELLKAREGSKRTREEKVLEWQRSQLSANMSSRPPLPAAHIKREGERRPPPAAAPPAPAGAPASARRARGVSPAAIAAALADSGDSESTASEEQPQRLTLSERFGKMAQWSADRSARLENMRITRREATLHVRIERGGEPRAPELDAEPYPGLDPAPVGSYPEELLAVAPGGLPSWDDVRVRYDYYKKRGYLRGLTLGDYVKWEEWWYKYQEWLKRERAYERWADGDVGTTRRERRRRGGRHRRS
ncbi:serine/arginine repetitive matrix protein 1 isoform X2 [Amyelois transitella]|uniref:serine/arginine repetitive matrix protein 1 isoform X2 n=1 Tax=Amyelois transitella TaxID=680683 RepID=UPI00298FE326|nr:serine/arginine repetitive matrix protein 1 isoform X2 [Amyelois transitella]